MTWRRLGKVEPRGLEPARLELHWAAQVLSAAASTLIPPAPGDQHTSLDFDPTGKLMKTQDLGYGQRLALGAETMQLSLLEASGATASTLELEGKRLEEALAWVEKGLAELRDGASVTLARPTYAMPESPIQNGEPFGPPRSDDLLELAAWFANGWELLKAWAAVTLGASRVALWPHHFDIGSILFLDPGAPPETQAQIGVGLSPGDGTYPEPYFYVTPWPVADGASLPELPARAHWQSKAFLGAILTGSELSGLSADEQSETVATYLKAAIEIGQSLVGTG